MQLVTQVDGTVSSVFERFDRKLLETLVPPGMSFKLKRYDEPVKPGSMVEVETKVFGLIPQFWRTEITEWVESGEESFFTDEGLKLPFPLKQWKHRHIVRKASEGVEIVDDVEFSAGWLSWLMYPAIWLQFAWRKPKYRKYFAN